MHVHACLLALHTGKPVKMSYNREESFFGHVHRHPAWMHYEHGFTRDGDLVFVRAQIWLDGGAYAVEHAGRRRQRRADGHRARTSCRTCRSTATARTRTTRRAVRCAASARCRPRSPTSRRWTRPPTALGHGPGRAALPQRDGGGLGRADRPGDRQPGAGGRAAAPAAGDADAGRGAGRRPTTCAGCPAGCRTRPTARACAAASATRWRTRTSAFSEGFDDYSTARVRLEVIGGEPVATVHTAAAEVGQGLVTVQQQIAAPSSASTGSSSRPRTPRSAAAARRRRPGRPTSPAARCARRAVRVRDRRARAGRARDALGRTSSTSVGRCCGDDARRGDRRVAAPARPRPVDPRDRPGLRARAVRVRRAPRGRRRRRRARPGQGRRAGLRPGRRQGHQPAGRASARSTAAARRAWGWR